MSVVILKLAPRANGFVVRVALVALLVLCTRVEAEAVLVYQLDDGTAIGAAGGLNSTVAMINQFTVTGGNEKITEILVDFGGAFGGVDDTVTAALWSDPNGDMSPLDAVLLASVTQTSDQAGGFNTFDIPDTTVGPNGTSFFVGVVWRDSYPLVEESLAVLRDFPATAMRSYWYAGSGVSASDPTGGTLQTQPGDWFIRATATVPETSAFLYGAIVSVMACGACRRKWRREA